MSLNQAVDLPTRKRVALAKLGLRLLRRTGEVICAVLDPSDVAPVLKTTGCIEESGRGLQMVDALSDVWGWSPVAGRGKAVWAILFSALGGPGRAGERASLRLSRHGRGVAGSGEGLHRFSPPPPKRPPRQAPPPQTGPGRAPPPSP